MSVPTLRAMKHRGVVAALRRSAHLQLEELSWEPLGSAVVSRRSYSNKLFVGGLSFRTDEEAVRKAFSPHGEVMEVKLVSDRETGRPKGFGFVTFGSESDADTARSKMSGQLLDGRIIRVDTAASPSRPPSPSTDVMMSRFTNTSSSVSPVPSSSQTSSGASMDEHVISGSEKLFGCRGGNLSTSLGSNTSGSEVAWLSSNASPFNSTSTANNGSEVPLINTPSASTWQSIVTSTTVSQSSLRSTTGEVHCLSKPGEPVASRNACSPASASSGTSDFFNVSPDNSSYHNKDLSLPHRRLRSRSRPTNMGSNLNSNASSSLHEMRSPFGSNNQFAETGIPKPKGPEFNFGLLNITATVRPGARPQGVFDIYISDDLPELPPPKEKPKPKPLSLMFPFGTLPALDLPWGTPEADNWSEIGKDPPKYDITNVYPTMKALLKPEYEFDWDPYDFDEEATLPPPEEVIEYDSDYD